MLMWLGLLRGRPAPAPHQHRRGPGGARGFPFLLPCRGPPPGGVKRMGGSPGPPLNTGEGRGGRGGEVVLSRFWGPRGGGKTGGGAGPRGPGGFCCGWGYCGGGLPPRRINRGGSGGRRGYPLFGYVAGTHAWMFNGEWRFPVTDFLTFGFPFGDIRFPGVQGARSEERRVGKEWRSRGAADH